MLTLDEIRTSKINPIIAREAHTQAEKRLADVLEVKKAFEQKAFTLFNAYSAISLTVFGVAGTLYKTGAPPDHVWPFAVVGLMFVVGAALFVCALLDASYGAFGSGPAMWLNKGTIDGDDTALGVMLAYLTFYHKERIDKSVQGNDRKANLIRFGIGVGIVAPVVLLATLIYG